MNLPVRTLADLTMLSPCYDPVVRGYLPKGWKGTVLDILKVTSCPAKDRLWVACHPGWIDDVTLRLFAVWCAKQALQWQKSKDPARLVDILETVEKYANGRATEAELQEAYRASRRYEEPCPVAEWEVQHAVIYSARCNAAYGAIRASSFAADAHLVSVGGLTREEVNTKLIEHLIEMLSV